MSVATLIDLPLSRITRLSPLNPRQDTTSDVTTLSATIRAVGLRQPPLVIKSPDDSGYEVLDGGRRWRALRLLEEQGDAPNVITCDVFSGTETEAREAALAVSITQKPLHPVDEYEAFRQLADAGMTTAQIAHDFAQSERQVRQRLALGRLSPRVLELWRAGQIDRDCAEAFTTGTIAAQEALLDEAADFDIERPYFIRSRLRLDELASGSSEAKFLRADPARIDAYIAAGGRIEESLFDEDGARFLDASIAHQTCDRLLLAEAEKIMQAEGWGAALLTTGDDPDPIERDGDYADDAERFDEIASTLRGPGLSSDKTSALIFELDEIELRALLRAFSAEERATLGVRVDIDSLGKIIIDRAVPLAQPSEDAAQDDDADDDESPVPATAKPDPAAPPAPTPEKPSKALRGVLDEAMNAALRDVTGRNLNLALAFAVAALGCSYGRDGIGLSDPNGYWRERPRSDLLESIKSERFETALARCASTPLNDLTTAFAELVARAIDVSKSDMQPALILIATAARLSGIRADLAAALNYDEYFLAATRDAAIEAIRALDGEAAASDAPKLKKTDLAKRAATLAKDRQWLPPDIADVLARAAPEPAPKAHEDTRSTAQAMAEAIAADVDHMRALGDGPLVTMTMIAPDANAQVAQWLLEQCTMDESARTKASLLAAAYDPWAALRDYPSLTTAQFSAALFAAGLEKTRTKTGVHYLGVTLKQAPAQAA